MSHRTITFACFVLGATAVWVLLAVREAVLSPRPRESSSASTAATVPVQENPAPVPTSVGRAIAAATPASRDLAPPAPPAPKPGAPKYDPLVAAPTVPEEPAYAVDPGPDVAAPTEEESEGQLAVYYDRWEQAEYDRDETTVLTQNIDQLLVDKQILPSAIFAECRDRICRINSTVLGEGDPEKLTGLGELAGGKVVAGTPKRVGETTVVTLYTLR